MEMKTMRHRVWLSFALLAAIRLASGPSPGFAQYMYLDANGDGVPSEDDRLNVPGKTVVDVWLSTDSNRDGSQAVCGSTGSLTLTSYEFNLVVSGGAVAWGSYSNNLSSTMGVNLGSSSTPTAFHAGF